MVTGVVSPPAGLTGRKLWQPWTPGEHAVLAAERDRPVTGDPIMRRSSTTVRTVESRVSLFDVYLAAGGG